MITEHNNQFASDADMQVLPLWRMELSETCQQYSGLPYWVIKDPVALRYFRFTREEYFIISHLKKKCTVGELKAAHLKEFRGEVLTNSDIGNFISGLLSKNLLNSTHEDRDRLLYDARKKKFQAKLKGQAISFMFFKIPVYDPNELFDKTLPYLKFIWTKTFSCIYIALFALAIWLLMSRWSHFTHMVAQDFFTMYNAPLLITAFYFSKVLHELGHGYMCKYHGGEVHQVGWLFMVFTPFFYCNVTDSWTFTSKYSRFIVTAAGILTELFIAAVATIIWYFTDEGFAHGLCFNLMVSCSIATVMFNLNPLLKYDGYYMLMDYIEVPNLRQRATAFVRNSFVKYVMGGHSDDKKEEHRYRFFFPIYAFCAFCYQWFILISILFTVHHILESVNLLWLARGLVTLAICTMFLLPLWKFGKFLTMKRESYGITQTRLLSLLTIFVIAFFVVVLWPMKQHVTLNFILEPARYEYVRTQIDGLLTFNERVKADAQIAVHQDDVINLATMENFQLTLEDKKVDELLQQAQIRLAKVNERSLGTVRDIVQEQVKKLMNDQKRIDEKISQLKIAAPFSGTILNNKSDIKALNHRYLSRGTPLMMLGDTTKLVAKVWVPEAQLGRIFDGVDLSQPQQQPKSEFMLYAFPKSKDHFFGKVISYNKHREESMGLFGEKLALSNKVGGEVGTEYDPITEQEKPIESVYEITIAIDQASLPKSARPYLSGRTRIQCGYSTLFNWGWDSLLQFIAPEIRL